MPWHSVKLLTPSSFSAHLILPHRNPNPMLIIPELQVSSPAAAKSLCDSAPPLQTCGEWVRRLPAEGEHYGPLSARLPFYDTALCLLPAQRAKATWSKSVNDLRNDVEHLWRYAQNRWPQKTVDFPGEHSHGFQVLLNDGNCSTTQTAARGDQYIFSISIGIYL